MFKKPLVAFDGSPDSLRALRVGVGIAKRLGTHLDVVIVEEDLPVTAVAASLPEGSLGPEAMDVIVEERAGHYNALRAKAEAIAAEHGVAARVAMVTGSEVEAIVEYAKAIRSDLLIFGYRKHTMMRDRLLGSTAHALSIAAPCSLLAVKAEGCPSLAEEEEPAAAEMPAGASPIPAA